MLLLLKITFWISVTGILHSYVFYPRLIKWLAGKKKPNDIVFTEEENLPFVTILMSVFNEEPVIEGKLNSLLSLDYPKEKLSILIGSDHSVDATNEIVSRFAEHHPVITFFPFEKRRGKPPVINDLATLALKNRKAGNRHIFLLTDANVILKPDTLINLVRHFRNENIGLVDAHLRNTGVKEEGIAISENRYINTEVRLKYNEGVWDGNMLGPFGGCFAIRSDYFVKIPPKYLVDDFFLAMKVFEKGGKAILDLDAYVYEAISIEIKEEYKRKKRISAGNFQNTVTFFRLWFPPFGKLSFAFFSHKILRWVSPFFMILSILSAGALAYSGLPLYKLAFAGLMFIFAGIPVLDFIFKKTGVYVKPVRNITYFIFMNLALLHGFFDYLKGVKSNIWDPPKRT